MRKLRLINDALNSFYDFFLSLWVYVEYCLNPAIWFVLGVGGFMILPTNPGRIVVPSFTILFVLYEWAKAAILLTWKSKFYYSEKIIYLWQVPRRSIEWKSNKKVEEDDS